MSKEQIYKATGFRQVLPERVRALLPEEWQQFNHRSRFSLVQFWYDDPAFHFEVWPQRNSNVIEVGLHLEHTKKEHNAALHRFFDAHFIEIRHELGEIWLEQWDRGWHKLYITHPFTQYTESLLKQVSEATAQQITVLQPYLVLGLEEIGVQVAGDEG